MRYSQFVILFFLVSSCITAYDLEPSQFHEAIVIQGMITDQPGPYVISVSKTIPIDEQGEDLGSMTGATVEIKDDQGNSEVLTEKTTGNFYTSTFQGVIGNTYTITVTTGDGGVYQSTPQKLSAVGDFSIRQPEFKQNEDPLANRQITSSNGFNIYVDSDLLPEQVGRVWWRWTGTYHIATFPFLRTTLESGPRGTAVVTPAPPVCSGYVVVKGALQYRSPCTCCDCWVTDYNQNTLLSDQKFINNNQIVNFNIGFIEANRRNMYDKYILDVEQLSLSEEVYNFWKAVSIQKSNSSNLFQTPPPKTGGNFTALTPNAIPAIGYFAACAVKTHSIELNQGLVPYAMLPIDTVAGSCLGVYKNSVTKKPVFW